MKGGRKMKDKGLFPSFVKRGEGRFGMVFKNYPMTKLLRPAE